MEVYVYHSQLFGSPRIITSNYALDTLLLNKVVNSDNNYSEDKKWILQQIPLWPDNSTRRV